MSNRHTNVQVLKEQRRFYSQQKEGLHKVERKFTTVSLLPFLVERLFLHPSVICPMVSIKHLTSHILLHYL